MCFDTKSVERNGICLCVCFFSFFLGLQPFFALRRVEHESNFSINIQQINNFRNYFPFLPLPSNGTLIRVLVHIVERTPCDKLSVHNTVAIAIGWQLAILNRQDCIDSAKHNFPLILLLTQRTERVVTY